MKKNRLQSEYFDWMYNLVFTDNKRSYKKLLKHLHTTPFTYTLCMDGNRFEDGINLRYIFGERVGILPVIIANEIDMCPCSVLEMIVSLVYRCDESIMWDDEIGDRKYEWFWNMLKSLNLVNMYDSHYDADYVDSVIFTLLNRQYTEDGRGGLFEIPYIDIDLRKIEIWRQMFLYLKAYY